MITVEEEELEPIKAEYVHGEIDIFELESRLEWAMENGEDRKNYSVVDWVKYYKEEALDNNRELRSVQVNEEAYNELLKAGLVTNGGGTIAVFGVGIHLNEEADYVEPERIVEPEKMVEKE